MGELAARSTAPEGRGAEPRPILLPSTGQKGMRAAGRLPCVRRAGGHGSLAFNHREAAVLGCEQRGGDRRGLLKSNIISCYYHPERRAEGLRTAGEL